MTQAHPIVIGLIGGVASGKSSVGRHLEKLGAKRLDADAVGHEALLASEVIEQLKQAFGADILDANGAIDRKTLGAKAFASPERVSELNGITHPWIRARMSERLSALKQELDLPAIVLDVSLLLESGAYEGQYDTLLFVDTPRALREQRAQEIRGWPQGELEKRERHQWPLEKKQAEANCVIHNDGSLSELEAQVEAFWHNTVSAREK